MDVERKDIEKLRSLADTATNALFELHDYLRRAEGEDGPWRSVYRARCDIGQITANAVNRWADEQKAAAADNDLSE